MADWKIISEHYMQNGNYTITKSPNVPLPYCLFQIKPQVLYGCFRTSKEAIQRYEEVKS